MQLLLDWLQFDPELQHLPVHQARCMLNMHLDSFCKNHRLNMPCPTHGYNMSSEHSAAHNCIHRKGRHLEYRSGQTLPSRGTCVLVCIPAAWSQMGKDIEMGTAATRLMTHVPSFPFLGYISQVTDRSVRMGCSC